MSRLYVVPAAERLDRIAKTLFGSERGRTVEVLLDVNPGLAALFDEVPAGTAILVPERVATPAASVTRPWD